MVSKIHQVHLLSEAEGNFVVACPMFVIGPFVWSYFCDKIVRILSSPPLFSLRKIRLIILHRVFYFLCVVFVFGYLWAYCEAILPFLWLQWGCAKQRREIHTAGELYGRQ